MHLVVSELIREYESSHAQLRGTAEIPAFSLKSFWCIQTAQANKSLKWKYSLNSFNSVHVLKLMILTHVFLTSSGPRHFISQLWYGFLYQNEPKQKFQIAVYAVGFISFDYDNIFVHKFCTVNHWNNLNIWLHWVVPTILLFQVICSFTLSKYYIYSSTWFVVLCTAHILLRNIVQIQPL